MRNRWGVVWVGGVRVRGGGGGGGVLVAGGTGDIGSQSSSFVHLLLILVPNFATFRFSQIYFAIRQFFLMFFEIV